MRPRTLTLQAFGSYAGELVVDFGRLGRHGVFAITGPTGAGKSTIFDAIVYALYDDLPGFRVDGNVRSQYAAPDVPTRVELQFEVRGERWCIERTPAQPVPRRRGPGGPTEKAGTVLLRRADSDRGGINRKQAVAAAVLDLVGLTKEQFEQVVLIPQGQFEEVLKADTRARAGLLRRLFPIDVFAATTERLQALAAERRASFDGAAADQEACLRRIGHAVATVADALPGDVPHTLADFDGAGSVPGPGAGSGFGPGSAAGPGSGSGPGARLAPESLPSVVTEVGRLGGVLSERVGRAKAELDAAAGALAEARDQAQRWREWKEAQALVAGFAAEEAEDAALAASLDRAKEVATLAPTLAQWQRSTATLAEAEPALEAERVRLRPLLAPEDGDALENATEAARLGERLASEAGRLAGAATGYEALEQRRRTLEDDRKALKVRAADHETAVAGLAQREAALAALGRTVEELARVAGGIEPARRRLDVADAALERARAVAEKTADVARLTGEVATAVRAEAEAQATFEETFRAWRSGQAGVLAAGLVEGEACPTCGSTHHPSPAPMVEGTPDDTTLAATGDRRDETARVRSALAGRLEEMQAALAALGDPGDLVALEAERTGAAEAVAKAEAAAVDHGTASARFRSETDEVDGARRRLDREAASLEEQGASLDGRQREWEVDRDAFAGAYGAYAPLAERAASAADLAAAVRELADQVGEVALARHARDQALDLLGPKLAELGLDDPAALAALARTVEDIAVAEQGLSDRHDRRLVARRVVADYEAAGGPAAEPDTTAVEERHRTADARHLDLVRRQGQFEAAAKEVRRAPDLLSAQAGAIEVARRSYEEVSSLADLCAGRGNGPVTTRLSLENWVLADYLRRVLVQANARLSTMTAGRYQLALADTATDGRKAFGLDLSVFDVNTGQFRAATTLSGGETFMAALALALGLADVVSGGSNREMGALFVDEGFGSLDPESLDAVVEVLRSLEDGGRIVGVISHVAEMQEALPSGITVESGNHGSVAVVHYPDD